MKIYRTPRLFEKLYSDKTWSLVCNKPTVFLTFDDGPTPELTSWILDVLGEFNAKATFFCVGSNALKHPELIVRIKDERHTIGNHTMNHVNGWNTTVDEYIHEVNEADKILSTKLFRPPYGKMKPQQYNKLKKEYKIVMWSFLTYDFLPQLDMNCVFEKYMKSYKSGDIIVLHDNIKSESQIKILLPQFLKWGKNNGISFNSISETL